MKTSNMRTGKFSSTVCKILMVLVFASMIGGISIAPVYGQDHNRRQGYYKQGRGHGQRVYYQRSTRYYYPAPVYAPPPVVYAPYPYQSPGISLVFPINIR